MLLPTDHHPVTRLSVSGFTLDINLTKASFSVTVTQFISDAVQPSTLIVHAQLLPTPQWPTPSHLPLQNQFVHFTGGISTVENNEVYVLLDNLEANPM